MPGRAPPSAGARRAARRRGGAGPPGARPRVPRRTPARTRRCCRAGRSLIFLVPPLRRRGRRARPRPGGAAAPARLAGPDRLRAASSPGASRAEVSPTPWTPNEPALELLEGGRHESVGALRRSGVRPSAPLGLKRGRWAPVGRVGAPHTCCAASAPPTTPAASACSNVGRGPSRLRAPQGSPEARKWQAARPRKISRDRRGTPHRSGRRGRLATGQLGEWKEAGPAASGRTHRHRPKGAMDGVEGHPGTRDRQRCEGHSRLRLGRSAIGGVAPGQVGLSLTRPRRCPADCSRPARL